MADFAATLKNILSKSAKFVGKTANNAAKATKYKLDELGNLSKRRELISELGTRIFESRQTIILPEESTEIIRQIESLDGELAVLRADHAAQKAAEAERHAAEKAARAAEKAAAKTAAAIQQSTAPVEVELPTPEMPVAEIDVADTEKPVAPVLEVNEAPVGEPVESDVPTLNV